MASNVQINPAQTALQNLLNLVDSQNPAGPSDPTQVTTSNLTTLTVGSVSSDPTANTSVEIDPSSGGKLYSGSVVVYYARESLADQIAAVGGTPTIPTSATTAAQQLAAVAAYYGFIPSEITWATAPTYPTGGGTVTGVIQSSGSLVYLDGTATISMTFVARNTLFLAHFNTAGGLTDATGNSTLTGTGSPAISTAQSKFGAGSLLLNGTSQYLTVNNAPALGSGDWTIECFLYPNTSPGNSNGEVYIDSGGSGTANAGYTPRIRWLNAGLSIYDQSNNNTAAANGVVTNGAWHHMAVVKKGTVETLYIDGIAVATVTNTGNYSKTSAVIGRTPGYSYYISCYMNEFRISNIARYSGTFTPPAAAFTLD